MKSAKLLFLFCLVLYGFNQVQGFKFIINKVNGTLSTDFLRLPAQVQHFEIGPNEIKAIETGAICTASALRTVKIDFTSTTKPPTLHQDMFKNCENLTDLTINGNKKHPTELKGSFCENFANLKHFTAEDFIIHRLTRDFFVGTAFLTVLTLPKCAIQEIDPGSFNDLKNLEIMTLRYNTIRLLPPNLFNNLAKLKTLDLSYNQIFSLNGVAFDGLSSLEFLHLEYNRIGSFDVDKDNHAGTFDDLKKLNTMWLGNNRITVLPKNMFKNLGQIKKLDLSHNNISHLDWDEFDGLSSIELLEVRSNRISSFDAENIFKYLPTVNEIWIDGNVGDCKAIEKSAKELQQKFGHTVLRSDTTYDYYNEEGCSLKNDDY